MAAVCTSPLCTLASLWQETWQRGCTELFAGGQRSKCKPCSTSQLKASPSCKWVRPQADKSKPAGLVPATSLPGAFEGGRLPVLTRWAVWVCTDPDLKAGCGQIAHGPENPLGQEDIPSQDQFLCNVARNICVAVSVRASSHSAFPHILEPLQNTPPLGSIADSADSCRQGLFVALIHSLQLFIPLHWVLCEARAKHCSCPRGI